MLFKNESSREPRSPRSRFAFTLVELLVVIGIIALLISILLPALNRARQSANQVKCMSNLKQVGTALFLYASIHKGTLPFGFLESNSTIAPNIPYVGPQEQWDTLVLWAISTRAANAQYSNATTGSPGSRGIFLCPQVNIETTTSDARLTHFSCHPVLFPNLKDLNPYTYMVSGGRVRKGMRPYKLGDFKRSAELAGIFDGAIENTQWGAYAVAFALHGGALFGNATAPSTASTFLVENFERTGIRENLDSPLNLKPWVSTGGIVNGDFTANQGNIRFRHNNDTKANALMMDGHVEVFNYNKKKPQESATDMKLRNVCVPAPK